jgi:hypothetical protein
MQNEAFQSYVISIACHVGDESNRELSSKYLPAKVVKEIRMVD